MDRILRRRRETLENIAPKAPHRRATRAPDSFVVENISGSGFRRPANSVGHEAPRKRVERPGPPPLLVVGRQEGVASADPRRTLRLAYELERA